MPSLKWIMRSLEPTNPYHRALFAVVALAVLVSVGAVFALDYDWWVVGETAVLVPATWALTRELDPDRQLTAIVAAVAAAAWALFDLPTQLLFMGGMVFAARITVGSTGQRPSVFELGLVALGASLISFTELGFIGGFALAVAIYVDNQQSGSPTREGLIAAIAAALGSALMATLTGAFPRSLPELQSVLVVSAAIITLLTVSWEPPEPTSQVDGPSKEFLTLGRLIAARVIVAMSCLGGAVLGDLEAAAVTPALVAVALAMASSEVERMTRSRLT